MLWRKKAVVVSVVCALVLVVFHVEARATDYYVDIELGTDDGSTPGTSSFPFKTITYAMSRASSNDVLKVIGGTTSAEYYTAANDEIFPIALKGGVSIIGQGTTLATYPRFGGDAGSSVDALFELDATSSDLASVEIRKLRFVGENVGSQDSPIALYANVANGHTAELHFEQNVCERPYMNASGSAGLATIHIEVTDGTITGAIANNEIQTSNRGGVELLSIQPNDVHSAASVDVTGNYFTNPGGAASLFAYRWYAPDVGGDGEQPTTLGIVVDNYIFGRSDALVTGIEVHADENTQGGQTLQIEHNLVEGCGGDGVVLTVDGWDDPNSPEIAGSINRNVIVNNGGSGVRFVFDPRHHETTLGYGYLALTMQGNLIADNDGFAIAVEGLGLNSHAYAACKGNTYAYNDDGGIGYSELAFGENPDEDFEPMTTHVNDVMYFNNGGGDQVLGVSSAQLALAETLISYCDWQGLTSCATSCTQSNIDEDPEFVKVGRIYHLDDGSPCIDIGNSNAADLCCAKSPPDAHASILRHRRSGLRVAASAREPVQSASTRVGFLVYGERPRERLS